jgi:hypothetical protein
MIRLVHINGLQFCYLYHDIDVIELRISVGNGRFSGSADVYVATGRLLEVCAALKGFPSNSDDERDLRFGAFGSRAACGGVRLQLKCKDLAGHPMIRATIEDGYNGREDTESSIVFIDFEPGALDDFVVALRRLEVQLKGCAELRALTSD